MLRTVLPVWALVLLGAILIAVFAPADEYLTWLPIALGVGVLVTFSIQLALLRKEGLVTRVMVSLGGSVVILAVATAILGTVALTTG